MRLGNHLKQHRARLDLTQEDLAGRVGVRRQTILAIEKGHYVPSTLLAVAANGLYVVGWLSEFLRPRVIGAASASA